MTVVGVTPSWLRSERILENFGVSEENWRTIVSAPQLADAYDVTDTDGSRPDCWGHLAAYGWDRQDGAGIEAFR